MLSLQNWNPPFGDTPNFFEGLGSMMSEADNPLLGVSPSALDRPRGAEGVMRANDFEGGAAVAEAFDNDFQDLWHEPIEHTEVKDQPVYPEDLLPASTTADEPTSGKRPTKRRASTRKARQPASSAKRASTTPPQEDEPQSKHQRSAKQVSPGSQSSSSHDVKGKGEETRRDKFLERNRIAASKCRQKRKEWMHSLEDRKQEAETLNWHLRNEYRLLVDEVGSLKNMLMQHAHCQDDNVQRWLESSARKIVSSEEASEESRDSSAGSMSAGVNFDEMRRDSLAQPSSATSWETPPGKEDEINYDHMPDAMFLDDAL